MLRRRFLRHQGNSNSSVASQAIEIPSRDATPSAKPVKLESKFDSLFNLSTSEKIKIGVLNFINGFSLISSVPSSAEVVTDYLFTISSALNVTVKIGQTFAVVATVGVGLAYGGYTAFDQITNEQERVIRLNKEFFLMLNMAADLFDEFSNEKEQDEKKENKELVEAYKTIRTKMHAVIKSNPMHYVYVTQTNPQQNDVDKGQIHEIIKAYSKHRKKSPLSKEVELWKMLKKDIKENDAIKISYFLNYSDVKQVKDYFRSEKKKHIKYYNKSLNKFRKDLELAANEIKNEQVKAEYRGSFAELIVALEEMYASAEEKIDNIFYHIPCRKRDLEVLLEVIKDTSNNIKQILSQDDKLNDLKNEIEETWDKELEPLVKKVENHLKNLLQEDSLKITRSTPEVFGENGSFRNYWRQTQTKIKLDSGERIPVNVDQLFYRGGARPNKKVIAKDAAITLVGLTMTANALFAASVVLGAAAMSASVIGLIAVGIALAFTLVSIVLSYHTKKIHNNREGLAERFNMQRGEVIASYNGFFGGQGRPSASRAQQMPEEPPVLEANSASPKASPGFFGGKVTPVDENKRGAGSQNKGLPVLSEEEAKPIPWSESFELP